MKIEKAIELLKLMKEGEEVEPGDADDALREAILALKSISFMVKEINRGGFDV